MNKYFDAYHEINVMIDGNHSFGVTFYFIPTRNEFEKAFFNGFTRVCD